MLDRDTLNYLIAVVSFVWLGSVHAAYYIVKHKEQSTVNYFVSVFLAVLLGPVGVLHALGLRNYRIDRLEADIFDLRQRRVINNEPRRR